MSNTLYVGNLPHECSAEHLTSFLSERGHAPTSVNLKTDRRTGRSRGFAFVEMASEEAAGEALEALAGSAIDGRDLKLGLAKAQDTGARSSGSYEDYGQRSGPKRGKGRR